MIGQHSIRDEDPPLLRGKGRYTDDGVRPGDLVMELLRSPVAAARISALDVDAALRTPGVCAIFTARDLAGLGHLAPRIRHPAPGGGEMWVPPFPPLADGAVRHLGEPVVAVLAETREAALDAVEAIEVDFEEVPSVTDPLEAAAPDAPPVWGEGRSNHCFRFERGNGDAVARGIDGARTVVRRRLRLSRVTAAPMEPRTIRASHDLSAGRFTLELGTPAPHRVAAGLADILGVEPDKVRVIARDCGGGFGMKNSPSREYAVALWAARRLGRPVCWRATRTEAFASDDHARDQWADATLALDAEGRFLALDVTIHAGLGAYLGPATPLPPTVNLGGMAGMYRFKAMHVTVDGMFTSTQPTSPYRGAGRPEATYVVERMIDLAARESGIDRIELRRRNLIQPTEMPYATALTFTYDCGDFPGVMDRALELGDWQGAAERKAASAEKGRLRGVGYCNAIEIAGGPLPAPAPEYAELTLQPDAAALVRLGATDTGQGHRTTFRQVLADRLGLSPGAMEVETGDTDLVPRGTGSFGSRTSAAAGTALWRAMDVIIERLAESAAEMLEVARADIEFDRGAYRVTGTDKSISFRTVLAAQKAPVAADHFGAADGVNFPNGGHVCEVEIDPETGEVTLDRYAVVDDVGTVINPLLVEAQIVGGAVQSIGQALMEQIVFEPETGQLLTASFMDYAMPRATDVPSFSTGTHSVPTATNPLGAKGVGESGTVGALAAVMSAVADALAPLGIDHVDMPATPDRVWAAIRAARR